MFNHVSRVYIVFLVLGLFTLPACAESVNDKQSADTYLPFATSTVTDVSDATSLPLPSVSSSTNTPIIAPIQGNYDIGGYSLYVTCRGHGSPTVVLEHGSGGTWQSWQLVEPSVAKFTQVCSYTRASKGVGPNPHTSQSSVDDLHKLLKVANLAPPYVLVGHSWGGMNARLFAAEYSDDVVGVVLVDSVNYTPEWLQRNIDFMNQAVARGEQWAIDEQQDLDFVYNPDTNPDGVDLLKSYEQVGAVTSLGDLPLVVVTAGIAPRGPRWSESYADMAKRDHSLLQQALVKLSTNSVQMIAQDIGHDVPHEDPAIIVEAIQKVIAMANQ